ncbi:tRNA (guanosine(46)-N7)-methyltransferase TrmB [Mycoplasmopsis arginini]|uniref:tRNA (guanine-N(7)-)-methyltransferase n=1 Tax=Mycoplasmopsis arginini TaxID=2094 RepID=A0AA43U2J9_MYCAR|nr:tRNA (guanosine(46)-N7)-methyltransferase TrmB [Mycoplasmopsis arginini]MDI3349314.1 tRNA (guanosine(46)-N7)-methyltransferase TrmB [Mycoplasmopsis arginini]
MRLRHNKNAIILLEDSEFYINNFPYELKENTVLEIGMGKGKMLSELAFLHPEINYIGMEKYSTPALSALKKIEKNSLKNMKIIVKDAIDLDKYFLGKVKTIWLTFSDPWPKKRHFKRRLVYKTFLEQYKRILAKDGMVYFKTDNQGLYMFALEQLEEFKGANIIYQTTDLHNCNFEIENCLTDYEQKNLKTKVKIYIL